MKTNKNKQPFKQMLSYQLKKILYMKVLIKQFIKRLKLKAKNLQFFKKLKRQLFEEK